MGPHRGGFRVRPTESGKESFCFHSFKPVTPSIAVTVVLPGLAKAYKRILTDFSCPDSTKLTPASAGFGSGTGVKVRYGWEGDPNHRLVRVFKSST